VIPKLITGRSFAGLAAYVLHDKGNAKTSERVAWTETRNLATTNPEAAWRVQAATALEAPRLKREAGIPATGRKTKNVVGHLMLSWHADESATLTREEMIAAADAALVALGAERHQAIYVAHNDEPQAHLHIIWNRISYEDGRALPSSNEKLKLSRWAEAYEKNRGQVYCEERVLNNAARRRGNYVRAKKDRPRHILELEAGHGEALWASRTRQQQLDLDLALRRKTDAQKARHSQEWSDLQLAFEAERIEQKKQAKARMTTAVQKVGAAFEDRFAELALTHHEERVAFAQRESSLFGKGLNILQSIDWSDLLHNKRRTGFIKEAFGLLGSRGARTEALRRRQQRETMALEHEMNDMKRRAAGAERRRQAKRLQKHRADYLLQRTMLEVQQALERSWIATEWQARRKARELAWENARAQAARQAFEKEATPEQERQKAAERFMGRMRKARLKREQDRGSGRLRDEFERGGDDGWER
jgi:hypothetical protein